METSNSSGKNSSSGIEPWVQLESGESRWELLDRGSRDKLILHFAPKVKIIALKLRSKLPQCIELNDLISAGSLGLLEALENFQPERGIKFTTYSESRIRGAMLDELRRMDWLSRGMRHKIRLLEESIRRFELERGKTPTNADLTDDTGLTMEEVEAGLEALQNQLCLSLDAIQDNFSPEDRGRIEYEPFLSTAQRDVIDKLTGLIHELTPKEKLVLSLYYSEELNMKEAASVMDVTEGRISQLHSQALSKLRNMFHERYGSASD